jgi:hypothetical protein
VTEQEKKAQLGDVVLAYQKAKQEGAHIDKKIYEIYKTYRTIGETMNRDRGTTRDSTVVNGHIVIGYGSDFEPSLLLNEAQLIEVLLERDRARERLKQAEQEMKSLGITDLK